MNLDAIAIALQANVPVLISGQPGTGKTRGTAQLCGEVLHWWHATIISSLREPSDFAGLPIITPSDVRGVRLAAPQWVYRAQEAEIGAIIFDEIDKCAVSTQFALLRVIHEGWVGDEKLPETIRRVAIMNPVSEGGGWEMQPTLANRFVHLPWILDDQAWLDGCRHGWPTPQVPILPEDWRDRLPKWIALATAFLDKRRNLIQRMPQELAAQSEAWASRRSWFDFAMPLLAACDAVGATEARMALLAGAVGEGVATEYLAWEHAQDLQDPEALLANPTSFVTPKRPDQVYATLAAVTAVATSPLTYERWCAAWEVLSLAADAVGLESPAAAGFPLTDVWYHRRLPEFEKRHIPPRVQAILRRFAPFMTAAGL